MKEGRKEGRKERRKEGRKVGRQVGKMELRKAWVMELRKEEQKYLYSLED